MHRPEMHRGRPARDLDIRVPPPILTLVLAIAMWFAATGDPSPFWRSAAALFLFMAAGVFGFPALRAFRRAGTTIDPVRIDRASVLVTGGVYAITRNPMYVALALLLASWAMWLGGLAVWVGPVFLVLWLDRFQIRPEERAMSARFGETYRNYTAQVRRWL